MIHIYINYYFSNSEERQSEYDYCLLKNLNNPLIDKVFIFLSENDSKLFHFQSSKMEQIKTDRPTYSDVIHLISKKTSIDDINIIINSDCYIDYDTTHLVKFIKEDEMWCMNKHDVIDSEFNLKFHDGSCSQDAWIFRGIPKDIQNINFNFGVPGCDNRFAYESKLSGYILKNPSLDLKIIHYHLSNLRSCPHKDWENFRINGFYEFVEPIKLT